MNYALIGVTTQVFQESSMKKVKRYTIEHKPNVIISYAEQVTQYTEQKCTVHNKCYFSGEDYAIME